MNEKNFSFVIIQLEFVARHPAPDILNTLAHAKDGGVKLTREASVMDLSVISK